MDKTSDYRLFVQDLSNQVELIPLLAKDVEVFGESAGWDFALIMQVNLVLEELIVNVIHYGYPDDRVGNINVLIEANAKEINVCITDDDDAFDPFQRESPDVSLDIDDRPIGGLGIYLAISYMDSHDYCYLENHNKVKLTKYLIASEP